MGKFISNMFLAALALGLSIFTGSRTLDLLAWALPAGQDIYQWLGLAAFEGGMYFWSFYFVSGAKGVPQRSISLCMAVFSVVAVCVATITDMTLDAGQDGKIAPLSPQAQQSMIVFVGVTVAVNVAAFLACKLMSIEKMREIAEGQAEDKIYGEGLRAIEAVAPTIAADAAPHLAADWSNRVWNKIVPGVQRQTLYLGPVTSAPAPLPALSAPAPAPEPLPLQSPAPLAPVVVPAAAPVPEKKPSALAKFKGFLAGSGKKQEVVTLSQTNHFPAHAAWAAKQDAQASAPAASEPVEDAARRSERDWAYVNGGAARDQVAADKAGVSLPKYLATRRPTRLPRNSHSSVAASRAARRAARYARPASVAQPADQVADQADQVAPAAPVEPAGPEHRTCSECGAVLDLKNAKQLTCSPACRTARARRLAAEKKARAGA